MLDHPLRENSRIGFHGPTGEEAMKRSKFSEQQIAFILRQAEEGTRVEEVCRKAGFRSRPITGGARSMVACARRSSSASVATTGRERSIVSMLARHSATGSSPPISGACRNRSPGRSRIAPCAGNAKDDGAESRTPLPGPSTGASSLVTCEIKCREGKGYSLRLSDSHDQEHPYATVRHWLRSPLASCFVTGSLVVG